MSYTTRLTPATWLMMRVDIFASKSYGSRDQSAVMKSSVCTARSAITFSYVRPSPMTPTDWIGSSTANACAVWRYQPACFNSSSRMASAWRSTVSRSARDRAEAAHRQAGAGERVAVDQRLRQAQLQAEAAHLVLEEVLERLDQLEAQFLRQTADVVMRLDVVGRAVHGAAALDHVGIQRALRQILTSAMCRASSLNTSMKTWPMRRRFSCGSLMPSSAFRKRSAGVDDVQVGLEMAVKRAPHRLRLALPQQAVVHEDARDLRARPP